MENAVKSVSRLYHLSGIRQVIARNGLDAAETIIPTPFGSFEL